MRVVLRIVLLLLLLAILATLAFQIPAVQDWAARRVSAEVSRITGTTFSVGHIGLTPFTEIDLVDVYALDERADTLLRAETLSVQFFRPIRSLLDRQLLVESIALRGARLRLTRDRARPSGNWDFLVERLGLRQTGDGPPNPNPFAFDLRRTTLYEVDVQYLDSIGGTAVALALDTLDLALDRLDLPGAVIDGDHVAGAGLSIAVRRFAGTPIDSDTVATGATPRAPSGKTDLTQPWSPLPRAYLALPRLRLERARFAYLDERRAPRPAGEFDPGNFVLDQLSIDLRDVALTPDSLGLRVAGVVARDAVSGLTLEEFSAGGLSLTPRELRLADYVLRTPGSRLGSALQLRVPAGSDWRSLREGARYDLTLDRAEVSIAELLALVPAAARIDGFRDFPRGTIALDAAVSGTLDRIKVDRLRLALPDGTRLDADLSARNLRNPKEAWLFVDVRALDAEVREVGRWLPGVKIPTALERLGAVRFAGSFTGFVTDFVAYGDLRTSLGRATLDTRFVRRGAVPTYTGAARVIDFDLGKFLDNPELGGLTASVDIVQGRGLQRETLQLDLTGAVTRFDFRGYTYHDIGLTGRLAPEGFRGELESRDPNADFTFDGAIDTRPGQEQFGFALDARNVDLAALYLAKFPWQIAGRFTVNSNSLDLDALVGSVTADSLHLTHPDGRVYDFDRLRATQAIAPDGDKRLVFESPQVQFDLSGRYQLARLPRILRGALAGAYPALYEQTGLAPVEVVDTSHTRLSLDARLLAVDSVLAVFGVPVRGLDGAALTLAFDQDRQNLDLSFSGVSPVLGGVTLGRFGFDLRGQSGELQLEGNVAQLGFGRFGFTGVRVFSEYADGEIRFGVSSDTASQVLGQIRLGGTIALGDTAVVFELDPTSHLDVGGERWTVDRGNRLTFGNRQLRAQDVVLRSGERYVEVESLGQRGVNVLMRKFDLELFNAYLNPDKIQIAGEVDAFFTAEDVYAQREITASVSVDTFRVNGVDWGAIQGLVTRADSTEAVAAYVTFSRYGQQAIIDAQLATATGQEIGGQPRPRNYFDSRITSQDFDMSFLSYFIPGITDLQGKLGADLHLYGTPDAITPEGGILVDEVGITVDYLQTRYFVDSQYVSIDSRLLDASGRQIRDRFGNVATLTGGLRHEGLKQWTLDVSLSTDRLQVLDTDARDNPLYYGEAYMAGRVAFGGPFNLTDIDIDATALADTRVVFPVSGASSESELRFIRFREPSDTASQTTASTLRGLNLDMDIRVTPVAELMLVFDESSGDIMRAQGSGDIDINIRRTGSYTMYGRYVIDQGDYLFTLLNVVNKPFTILEGGTINWTGDPFSADLNLVARYDGLFVAPGTLIPDFLAGRPDLQALASERTPVDLLMKLTGDLQRPNLGFEISLPELQGELRGYVNSKLALIRQDENELNRQVFGLIVIGQFLNNSTGLQASSVGVNTISELFSNQLSYLLTELFSSLAGSDGALTGLDLDINLQNNSSLAGLGAGVATGNDLQTRLRTYFLEDRLEIGASVSIGQGGARQGNFAAGRFEVTYAISDNRRLRLKTFLSRDNNVNTGTLNRAGVGLVWRREFDSFGELFGAAQSPRRREQEQPTIFSTPTKPF